MIAAVARSTRGLRWTPETSVARRRRSASVSMSGCSSATGLLLQLGEQALGLRGVVADVCGLDDEGPVAGDAEDHPVEKRAARERLGCGGEHGVRSGDAAQ